MPPHLRNGRDLSAEQRLRYQLSPAAEERLRRARISLATIGQRLPDAARGRASPSGYRDSAGPVQPAGKFTSAGVEQINPSTSPCGERAHESSSPSTNYEPRRSTPRSADGLSSPSAHSEPVPSRLLRSDGRHTRRGGNNWSSESLQRPI